ncbi:DUF3908 family protein [Heyndrickxia oleronia]|uniref:DUF3908 family protein n=1 Tax=Heyndrickxia oleronia TaxID=38875 RepID=UPI002041C53D|nr:DUF3908 family protein [Heyndrickxia oleronia]
MLDKEHFFYPKYLWLKDKDIELFFITEDKLIKCTLAEVRMINIKTKFLKDVSQLDLRKLNIDLHEIELKVTFTDGEIFTFSNNDSSMSWKYNYYLEVLELYRRLS